MLRRGLWGLAIAVAVVTLAAVGVFAWWRRGGRPQRSGTARVPELSADVDVRFDELGVPHVVAANAEDLARALGWLHANDRIGQMELTRRAVSGRLSELLGERGVGFDLRFRRLRARATAERTLSALEPASTRLLEAYAQGVNAWLTERGGDLPPDLTLLRARPEPWTPVDSLCVNFYMAYMLAYSAPREDTRLAWLAELGEERTRDLVGGEFELASETREVATELARKRAPAVQQRAKDSQSQNGSNNFAVDASRSANGHALVANDPHLQLGLPALWYEALLRAPDYEASGFTIPGLPMVVIGQGPHVAWSFTNTELDVCDEFLERLSDDRRSVARGETWLPITFERETIHVRGAADVELELAHTEIGPLLGFDGSSPGPPRSIAWTAYEPFDPLKSFLALSRAPSVDEVPAAIDSFVCPVQNLVCGDDRGAILYTVLGRAPRRGRGDGKLPAPAWNDAYAWRGLLPHASNPRIVHPSDGLLATANDDPAARGAPFPCGADVAVPHRADRIRERLDAARNWTPRELADVQGDVTSRYAREVVAHLRELATPSRAAAALLAWDGSMEMHGPSALYALFERELVDGIFGDELRAHALGGLPQPERDRVLLDALSNQLHANWFDDVATPAVEERAGVIQAALERAWSTGSARWGDDVARWRWGELHTWRPHHALGDAPVVGGFFDRAELAVPGNATTPRVFSGAWVGDRVAVSHGASMRYVADAADPDRSLAVLPTGQSGHAFDAHYDDQLGAYLAGELHAMRWSENAIEAHTASRLLLAPAR